MEKCSPEMQEIIRNELLKKCKLYDPNDPKMKDSKSVHDYYTIGVNCKSYQEQKVKYYALVTEYTMCNDVIEGLEYDEGLQWYETPQEFIDETYRIGMGALEVRVGNFSNENDEFNFKWYQSLPFKL